MIIDDTNSIICETLEGFLHIILNSRIDIESTSTHLYFRGESKYHRFIIPSLYLNEELTMSSCVYYYRNLLSQLGSNDYSISSSLFRQISEFQHYGAKTRILDITVNPLIALFFAVEKHEEDGYIYLYGSYPKKLRHDPKAEHFDVGLTTAIKSALNLMPQDRINNFIKDCEMIKSSLTVEQWEDIRVQHIDNLHTTDILKYNHNMPFNKTNRIMMLQFLSLLHQRVKVNEQLVYPFMIFEDITQSQIVIPSRCTDRIKQQQGAFIFSRYVNTEGKSMNEIKSEVENSINNLLTSIITPQGKKISTIIIPGEKKPIIRNQLAKLGITEGFVYPEIEHLSNTLLENL